MTTEKRGAFHQYRDRLIHEWSGIIAVLGISLIPLFLILDYFTMPAELLRRFAVYRLVATALSAAHYGVLRKTKPSRYSYLHGYAFSLYVGGMIVRMTVDLGGFNSAYYAGLNLVIVAVDLLLPWPALHSGINGAMVIALYVIANGIWGGPFVVSTLINNLYFLVSTVIIAVAINYTKHGLIEQEFALRVDLKAARDALWGEMEVAKRIQTALLPKDRALGSYQVAAVMQTADEVGGDYYDIIETRAKEHWLAIGDVSGHGVESGLVMMMTQTSILAMVNDFTGRLPSDVFEGVNSVLRENISRLGTAKYMTLNLIRAAPDRLMIAGKHQDLLVHRQKTGSVDVVSNEGCWIGVVPDVRGVVTDLEVRLDPGDTLLLFTDGATEATRADGEMFGQERLAAAFREAVRNPWNQILAHLLEQITRFQRRQQDDVTLMIVRKVA